MARDSVASPTHLTLPAVAEADADAGRGPVGAGLPAIGAPGRLDAELLREAGDAAAMYAAQQPRRGPGKNRFTLKGGYYGSTEDALDDGYIVNAAWTTFQSEWLAAEFEIGYLDAEGKEGGVATDLWAIPTMANGRVNVPAGPFELYGGLGIGTLYYEVDATAGPVRIGVDGWVLAGNAFAGVTMNLDRMAVGIEAKYYVTDDIVESNDGLDAFVVMLTLGFSM